MTVITGILLAAGSSQRFGGNKLLAEIDNLPLILHSARSLSPCDRIIAVVRGEDRQLQNLLHQHSIETLINEHASDGLGASIACGIRASESSNGWCLLPADMPFIRKSTTVEIVEALNDAHDIVAPCYQKQRGHPVGFSSRFRDQLLALNKDLGARDIITGNRDRLLLIDMHDKGILVDIDTPEDLQLLMMHGNRIS